MSTFRPTRLHLVAAATCLSTVIAGCGVVRSMFGVNTVDLEDAQVQAMRLDLRKEQKTICPREAVQLGVFLQAQLDGESEPRWFETWQGRANVDKNGKIEFDEVALDTDLGTIDDNGWLTPKSDLLASVDREIQVHAVYRRDPSRIQATAKYRPDYDCILAGGARGTPGARGGSGRNGTVGGTAHYGQTGADGNIGIPGESGGNGGPGPGVKAIATFVKTPFYEKLVAVRIEGAAPDFLLFPPGKVITLLAIGGDGGYGGRGGDGGPGGNGGNGDPTPGAGGRGGDGARGGNGGNGGPGGSVDLTFDERFPELEKAFQLDASGGAAGRAGAGGRGGRGGSGGLQPRDTMAQGGGQGERGTDGTNGKPGMPGKAGIPGVTTAHPGEVADRFAGLRGITPL